jgi:serine/threonine-protein kinase
MIGAEPPTPLRSWRTDIPEQLEAVIMRCLQKELHARTQTVAELARGLAPFGSMDSRLSVERILRVLSDHTPLPPPRPSQPSQPDEGKSSPSGRAAVPIPPGRPSDSGSGARPSAPRAVDSTTAMASTLAQPEPSSPDRTNTHRSLPRPSRKVMPLMVGGAVGLLLLGTVALFVLRPASAPSASDNALGAPSALAPSAAVEAAPTAAPVIVTAEPVPAPPAATELAAPPPSASASASASALASASPSAAPRATAAPKPAPLPAKTGAVRAAPSSTKKNPKDPMDHWR